MNLLPLMVNPYAGMMAELRKWISMLTVGAVQQYNPAITKLLQDAVPQWDAAGQNYSWVLVGDTYTPSDAHTTVADLGTGGTEAQVFGDTAGWINSGDGAPIAVGSRAVAHVSGTAQIRGGNAAFGNPVTIQGVKYLVCVKGDHTSIQTSDELMFWINLRTEDANEVSASNSEFTVQAPDVGGQAVWYRINAQA